MDATAWMEQNREWFRQQFPWLFELRQALMAEGGRLPAHTPGYPALLHEELGILSWCLRLSYELGLGWPAVNSCECSDKIGSLLQGIRELGELETQLREHRVTVDRLLSSR